MPNDPLEVSPERTPTLTRQEVPGSGNIFTASGDIHIVQHGPASEGTTLKEPSASTATETNLTHYLNWVEEQCGWVDWDVAGPNSELPTEFWQTDKRYVTLHVRTPYGPHASGGRQDLLAALESNRLIAILGEAGEGKTTASRKIAYYYSQRASANDTAIVPILLEAATIAESSDSENDRDPRVGEFLAKWNSEISHEEWGLPADWLQAMLASGRALVMIDALDDVSEAPRRRLLKLIRNCAAHWKRSRWCVLSRASAWFGTEVPAFRVAEICDLDDAACQVYIDNWDRDLDALRPDGVPKVPFSHDLRQAISETPALRELARRPLFLTAICLIYWRGRKLPTSRSSLFDMITEWLIGSGGGPNFGIGSKARLDAYSIVALAMLDGLPAKNLGDPNQLARYLTDSVTGIKGLNLQDALGLLKSEASALRILKFDRGMYFFSSRRFQEYFAARCLAMLDDGWVNVVRRRISDESWAEVFALYAAILVAGSHYETAAELVKELLKISNSRTLREKATAIGRVVAVFRDVLPEDYDLESIEDYRTLSEEVAAIFDPAVADSVPIEERYHAAVVLGVRGDRRLRGVAPKMIPVPKGSVLVGAQASDSEAGNYDRNAGPLERTVSVFSGDFEIGRYPVTVHEYERFVAGGGYTEHGRKYWDQTGWTVREREQRSAPRNWDAQRRTPNYPVTGVNVFEAEAYCRWLTEQTDDGWCYRLPCADEWEFAARRRDQAYRAFSWGDEEKDFSNVFAFSRVVPVGLFAEDRSVSGLCDLSGNVSEWTLDDAGPMRESIVRLAPRPVRDAKGHGSRVIKGGNYRNAPRSNRTAAWSGKQDVQAYAYVGFRVLRRPKPVKIKEELPTLNHPCSLSDWFAYYDHQFQMPEVSRTDLLNDVDSGFGEKMDRFLFELLPPSSRGRVLSPCRLGDHPDKFAYDLVYQDSRIKVACEKLGGRGLDAARYEDVECRLQVAACVLASPYMNGPVWSDLNDNDLDAIIFEILRHFEPGRNAELHAANIAANNVALEALPSLDELSTWELIEVVKYQIFAGVRLLKTAEFDLARQFGKMTHFFDRALGKLLELAVRGGTLLFLFDDNGELVWDLAMIELLLNRYPKLAVIGVVSAEVVGNNATQATLDACLSHSRFTHLAVKHRHRFKIHQERNARPCIDPACASLEFQRLWENVDAVYVKGVHGFETLQKLPKPVFYAFVVYSNDSVRCSGFERDTALFIAVPDQYLCFEYGNEARTLRHRLERLGNW